MNKINFGAVTVNAAGITSVIKTVINLLGVRIEVIIYLFLPQKVDL